MYDIIKDTHFNLMKNFLSWYQLHIKSPIKEEYGRDKLQMPSYSRTNGPFESKENKKHH